MKHQDTARATAGHRLRHAVALALALALPGAAWTQTLSKPAPDVAGQAGTPPVAAPASDRDRPAPAVVDQAIAARAQARWAALIKGDFAAAYAFETPAYRKLHDLDAYRRQFGAAASWTGVEVIAARPAEDETIARLVLMLAYRVTLPSGELYDGRRRVDETWIRVEDQWWFSRQ